MRQTGEKGGGVRQTRETGVWGWRDRERQIGGSDWGEGGGRES